MLQNNISFFAAAALIAISSGTVFADGSVEKGKRVYNKCKICHSLNQKKNKIGPHLVGIIGRKAGSVENFKYSSAMKKSGVVWNEKSLNSYLENPKKFVPGNKMTFAGLKKEAQRKDVIAYIKANSAGK